MKKEVVFSVILIVALGLAAYGNALGGAFIWDDRGLVQENVYVKSFRYLPQVFTRDIGAGLGYEWNFYRPLQLISYMVDHALWGLKPLGYHLTSVLVHVLAAIGVYALARAVSGDNALAATAGALFVVHPVHTEAVTYIAGRADPLALLFMLACFVLYLRDAASGKGKGWLAGAAMCISYALALLSKESALILPVLLLLYHFNFATRVRAGRFAAVVAVAGVYVLARMTVLKAMLSNVSYETTLAQRLPGSFAALAGYVKLLVWPFGLHMEHGNRLFAWSDPRVVAGMVLFAALLVFALNRRKRDALSFFASAWFLIALMPVANLFPVNAYMAEHWLYVPSVGFVLLLARLARGLPRPRAMTAAAAALAVFFAALTLRQNIHWREPVAFYEWTLKFAPNSTRVMNNLGYEYNAVGRKRDAEAIFRKVITVEPDNAEARNNLGNVVKSEGRLDEAVVLYRKAVALKADYLEALYNLANALRDRDGPGDREDALEAYEAVVALRPDHAEAHFRLGILYASSGKTGKAAEAYERVIALTPGNVRAYGNLGNIYKDSGDIDKAAELYNQAIAIDPDYGFAYYNLVTIYVQRQQFRKALECLDHATAQGLDNPKWRKLLQAALEKEGGGS